MKVFYGLKSTILMVTIFSSICFNGLAQNEQTNLVNNKIDYGTVMDIEENTYKTVKIGDQEWMAENLKTTKYNDGMEIPNASDEWDGELKTGAYCWYNNDITYKDIYGALYNWYVLETGKLCPKGWHVPSDAEWTQMEVYLQNNNYNYDGSVDNSKGRVSKNKLAKALASETGWKKMTSEGVVGNDDYPDFRNKTGFTALPGGYRYFHGRYSEVDVCGYWWSLSESHVTGERWSRGICPNVTAVRKLGYDARAGLSVRCIKD